MDINQKLLAAFQVEHVEHLEGIRACLANWRQDAGTPDIDEAFRHAHSLKGAARVTGLAPVEALAHQLESLFAQLRSAKLRLDEPALKLINAALDAIEDSAACLLEGRVPPDAGAMLAALDGVARGAQGTPGREPPQPGADEPPGCEDQSPASRQEPREPRPPARAAVETVRLSAENLDRLLQSTGQLLTENLQQGSLGRELNAIHQQLAAVQREWESLKRTTAGPLRGMSATPELAGVARYVALVEHEFSGLSRRIRAVRLLQQRSSWSMRLLAEQLQEDVCQARMVPAESEFQSFRKMMRELAHDLGKQLEFRVAGFEVLADRMVLQALKDPLMHVLRNAATHGIESAAERQARGKSPTGIVTLAIQAVGSRLTIAVEDDGGGVDLARVSKVAVEHGLLSESGAAARSADELTALLFQPGFSTSRIVTELSGRGMGLSAAYEAVARLQGEIELRPRPGGGTSIVIAVPLSISTHRLLLVACEDQTIAIPFYAVEGLHHVPLEEIQSIEGIPTVALGGQLTPLVGLLRLLDPARPDDVLNGELLSLVVLRAGSKRVAVAVDALVAQRNALIKRLGPPADGLHAWLGGILLEDASVAPVLNPAELVERFKPAKRSVTFQPAPAAGEVHQPTILVVDDSFTTRTLETSILEANGYRVRVAVDGIEALERLRSDKIDLVISDIQMPRLDGFGLLKEIKADPRWARIPVIVVSSVETTEDQERGLSLGADAYIVKRRFDHQELLMAVQQTL